MPNPGPHMLEPEAFNRFGDLLRHLRLRAQLTQRELSIAVGYNFTQISRLESGQRLPDPEVIAAVFVPALDLGGEPAWAERLVALARGAARQALTRDLPPTRDPRPAPEHTGQPGPGAPAPSTIPLLVTKLSVPRLRPDILTRARLLRQLDAALTVPLTLVMAGAGFGKTTLVASWLRQGEGAGKVAWLSLEASDDDLGTFLRYLVAALQTVAPAAGAGVMAALRAPQQPALPSLLASLVNDLAAAAEAIVLALDDYHLLHAPPIHEGVAWLVEHLPPHVHLIIMSREDPPLPLARLRARRQLVELRAQELSFDQLETRDFFAEMLRLPLAEGDLATLWARTEGWVAGLQLAALALRQHADYASVIQRLGGSHRYILDYLVAEVLAHQPAHRRRFLLQTAILERLCGPLCDAVMGLDDPAARPADERAPRPAPAAPGGASAYSQLMLDELERAGLFLVPLDEGRVWYRYHHLFAEMLRAHLQGGANQAEVARLHRRAAAWFAGQGLADEAIRHALAAGDPEQAADLIEQRAETMLITAEMATLRRWLEGLPEAVVTARHRLALAAASARLITGAAASIEPLIQAAERAARGRDPGAPARAAGTPGAGDQGWLDDVASNAQLLRSIVARAQGDLPQAIALGQAVLDRVPRQFVFMRSSAAWNVGMAAWSSGDLADAEAKFVEVWAASQSADQGYMLSAAAASLGQIRVVQGRLHDAAQIYRQALQQSKALHVEVPSVGLLHVGLADVLREWDDLEQAGRHLTAALELGRQFGNPEVVAAGQVIWARLHLAQGDEGAARAALEQATATTPEVVFDLGLAHRARVLLALGDLEAAERWTLRGWLSADARVGYAHESEQLILARTLLARRAFGAAARLLEHLDAAARAGGRRGTRVETNILLALALDGAGNGPRAHAALAQALSVGEPEGYLRSFLDEGAPLAALLSRWLEDSAPDHRSRPYAARLLQAFSS